MTARAGRQVASANLCKVFDGCGFRSSLSGLKYFDRDAAALRKLSVSVIMVSPRPKIQGRKKKNDKGEQAESYNSQPHRSIPTNRSNR